jgi:hypothetical protein
MLGVAGVLGQEILKPGVWWYEAALPQNLPGPFQNVNLGGLLAFQFILFHWVEVRRWMDIRNFGSVNEVSVDAFGGFACFFANFCACPPLLALCFVRSAVSLLLLSCAATSACVCCCDSLCLALVRAARGAAPTRPPWHAP